MFYIFDDDVYVMFIQVYSLYLTEPEDGLLKVKRRTVYVMRQYNIYCFIVRRLTNIFKLFKEKL